MILYRWWPRVTVMINQQKTVWMCAINSSCAEYVIISKHLWIAMVPWLRPSFSINFSFIILICRKTISFWLLGMNFYFCYSPYPSLFIVHPFKKTLWLWPIWLRHLQWKVHFLLCLAVLVKQHCPLVAVSKSVTGRKKKHLLRAHGCLYHHKSLSFNLVSPHLLSLMKQLWAFITI